VGAGAVWASANAGSKAAAKTAPLAHASTHRKTFPHRRKRRVTANAPYVRNSISIQPPNQFERGIGHLIFKGLLLALKRLVTDVALTQLCRTATGSI
jgi:hypothetical protein